jgi:phosphate transport system protein
MQHISKHFDHELEHLREAVLKMGGVVEDQVSKAGQIWSTDNTAELAAQVREMDQTVNDMELEIDRTCIQVIARRQPTASDLRLVMTVSKVVTDLERIGDEATKIARFGSKNAHWFNQHSALFSQIYQLIQESNTLLRQSLDSFARVSVSDARQNILDDETLDKHFREISAATLDGLRQDKLDPALGVELLLSAKAAERIGDHAKNIAEQVIFLVEGTDVRHQNSRTHDSKQP